MRPHPKPPKRYTISKDEPPTKRKKLREALNDKLYARDRGVCQLCFREHIPMSKHHVYFPGGSDYIEEILTTCWDCHNTIHHGNHGSDEMRRKAEKRMEEINDNQRPL